MVNTTSLAIAPFHGDCVRRPKFAVLCIVCSNFVQIPVVFFVDSVAVNSPVNSCIVVVSHATIVSWIEIACVLHEFVVESAGFLSVVQILETMLPTQGK